MLYVILPLTDSDYPFGIFKLFLIRLYKCESILEERLPVDQQKMIFEEDYCLIQCCAH